MDGEDLPKHEEGDPGDMEKWEELVEPEEVEVRNYTMVEPLASRQGHQLLGALARMVARLNYLNLPVRRVHSDRAGELASKAMRRWCSHREILRTYTSGGDWKANGRAEGEVGLIRRGINVVLKATGLPEEQWPMIARHVGERRGRLQLEALGYVTAELLSYNREVMVKTKSWDDFQGHWRARRRRGWVRGPDVSMSLTSGGHVVETEEGKFVRVVDVVPSEQPEGEDGGLEGALDVQERKTGEGPLRALGEPRFRLREKTAVKDLVVEELQQRLWRGSELANEELRKVEVGKEYDGVAMDLIYQVDSENEEIARRLEEVQMKACQVELEGVQEFSEELFLQTRTVGLQEVRKNLEDWVPSMKAEVDNFVSNQAIQRVFKGEAELVMEQARLSGKSVEVIPAMGVFTRKSGSGRHRSRIVCCGNRMNDRATEELYASGADATQVRTLLRKAALMNWDVMSLDVKCAFLLAPTSQDELIVVQPPRILEEAGLVNAQERWIVTGAMYGLTTALWDWAGHRDNTLCTMEWTQVVDGQPMTLGLVAMKDSNLWAIKEVKNVEKKLYGEVRGFVAIYVDDFLTVGPKAVEEELTKRLNSLWPTSAPEFAEVGSEPMKFLGMEIQREADGGYLLHQKSYARELLNRHEVVTESPYVRVPEEKEVVQPTLASEAGPEAHWRAVVAEWSDPTGCGSSDSTHVAEGHARPGLGH